VEGWDVKRPENTMCAAARRQQTLGTLARSRRGEGEEPKSSTLSTPWSSK
jgi:hypothetical protein